MAVSLEVRFGKKMRDGEVGEKGWGMELDERVVRLRKGGEGKER